MKALRFSLFLAALTPIACAQDDASPTQNATDPIYEPLKAFLGNWTCDVSYAGQTSTATETYESLCNGMFLKSIVHGTFGGQPFHGVSIWGYDPQAKQYVNVWADSMSTTAAWTTGTYDAKTKTWSTTTMQGNTKTRGVTTWKDANSFTEVSYMTQNGKDVEHMRIARTRAKTATQAITDAASTAAGAAQTTVEKAAVAVAQPVATASSGHSELLKSVGKWDVVIKVMGEDGATTEFKAKDSSSAACGGNWVWSDFHADDFMGQPFTGAGLVGYDPSTKEFTNYWVDTMGPYITKLTGTYDEKTKTLTCSGIARGGDGAEMPMRQATTWKDDNSFVCSFTMGSGEQSMKMEMLYTRSHEVPDHKIPEAHTLPGAKKSK